MSPGFIFWPLFSLFITPLYTCLDLYYYPSSPHIFINFYSRAQHHLTMINTFDTFQLMMWGHWEFSKGFWRMLYGGHPYANTSLTDQRDTWFENPKDPIKCAIICPNNRKPKSFDRFCDNMRVHSTNPSAFTCFTCRAGHGLAQQPYLIKFYTFLQPEWLGYPGRTVPIGIAERGFTKNFVRVTGMSGFLENRLVLKHGSIAYHPRAVNFE